ncbi:MAG: alpha/beta fold hydrolase [Burkholderiaceae bacterium]|nr:alpha/beta fold hydrolase [Burkholderiaceae bacterium]
MSADRPDDLDRGAANRRAMLGDAWVERSLGQANRLTAEFQSLVTRHAWHDIWGRPGLDRTTRRLLVLGMTMGLARWEEFELHCRAALRGGVPLAAIEETLLQGAIYCGVPAANTAFKITAAVCQSEGIALDPVPLLGGTRVETHHTFSLPQLRVALQGADAGVPVVMSHALGMDLTMWDALAAELAPQHPVLRYDHRGQGGSAPLRSGYALDDLVADAARLIGEWGRGPVVFVGLSMGGLVAQGLAIRHPQLVKGLLLANTAATYPEANRQGLLQRCDAVREGGMATIADAVVDRFLTPATRTDRPDLAASVRAQVLRADPAGYAEACLAIRAADWRAELGRIACPVQVVAGALDLGSTVAMAQEIADGIPGARLDVLQSAHLSVLEQPQGFLAALATLLSRLG